MDEIEHPSASGSGSSFRVLERPASKGKSFDGGVSLKKGGSPVPRPPPKDGSGYEEDDGFATGHLDVGNR